MTGPRPWTWCSGRGSGCTGRMPTSRACLADDRDHAAVPEPAEGADPCPDADITVTETAPDPADDGALAGGRPQVCLPRALEDPRPDPEDHLVSWKVVDAFMAAARAGESDRLLRLLAPDVVISADDDAVLAGTPKRVEGQHDVATFFNGSAHAALPVFVGDHAGAAWFHRGEAKGRNDGADHGCHIPRGADRQMDMPPWIPHGSTKGIPA